MKPHVLDSNALMAFFENRAGAEKVGAVLERAVGGKEPILMSVINWGEVYYSVWRARGEEFAREKLMEIAQLPIELVEAGVDLTKAAASLKAQHHLPYAGGFAAALASANKAVLVTGDRDFERVADLINILWL